MSLYRVELPKDIAIFWRKTLGDSKGQFGIDWLRRNSPVAAGATLAEIAESALVWKGYQKALDDIEDSLTEIPQKQQPLDEPPLETPDPR